MKWIILIVMTFAPPKPDYDSMVVTTKDNNLMIFGSYGKCYTYIHDNASILMKLGKKNLSRFHRNRKHILQNEII